jgi:hypothetical protein
METLALQASVEEAIKQYESRLRKAKLWVSHIDATIESIWLSHSDWMGFRFLSKNWVVSFAKKPPSVEVINLDEIPEEYKKQKVEVSADKNKISEVLKWGGSIPWVQLITWKYRLSIE